MEISLKQRLVGATVLIALGVIFIPMLLDGAGRREKITMDMVIPPEPEFTFQQQLPPVPTEPAIISQSPTSDVVKSGSEASTEAEPSSVEVAKPAATTTPMPAGTDSKPKPQRAVAKNLPEKQVEAPKPAPKAKIEAAPKPALNAWVVQVGSFGQHQNAVALRDKLRAVGYAAFEEKAGAPDAPVFRVKVGPELKRERAEKLQAKLFKEEKLDGIVVSHP